jgi:hypothetical protein
LSLLKGDASLEVVLLGIKQLATTYGISVSAGISYSFGSLLLPNNLSLSHLCSF